MERIRLFGAEGEELLVYEFYGKGEHGYFSRSSPLGFFGAIDKEYAWKKAYAALTADCPEGGQPNFALVPQIKLGHSWTYEGVSTWQRPTLEEFKQMVSCEEVRVRES